MLTAARTTTLLIVGILTVGFVAYAVYDGATRSRSADDRATIRTELTETREDFEQQKAATAAQEAATSALADQVESLGEEPVVEPEEASRSVLVPVPGPRGPGPTVAQVLAAINAYCDRNDDCTPPAPKDGKDGAAGQDSTIPGPEGPAGRDGTNGSDGSDGKDGTDGTNGRGIESLDCSTLTPKTTFTITFTDGTTQTIACS